MKMRLPGMADSSLNMTPMIDIVFQLILFFLLNLRFKSLDYRFEAQLPKDHGVNVDYRNVEQPPKLTVSLFRLDDADPEHARTKIKFAGAEWVLPAHGTYEERETTFASLRRKISEVSKATALVEGVIKTPAPTGACVPHGDVMKVLDTFMELELSQVQFEGTASPLPRRH
jgi:hypothetical protein